MIFRFYPKNGSAPRVLTDEELREHLSDLSIQEAVNAKIADPMEEVSYMSVGGFIICEFE